MKKSLIAKISFNVLMSTAIVSSMGTAAFAKSDQSPTSATESKVDKNEQLLSNMSVDDVLNNPLFSDLTFNTNKVNFYKKIEKYKKDDPKLSDKQLVKKIQEDFDNQIRDGKITIQEAFYDPYVSQWKKLTDAEKILVVTTPGQALVVDSCRDKAVAYEEASKYKDQNGNGTQRDAFRHAIWNALMCRYINKPSAYIWATAHEDHDSAYYSQVFDGFTGRQHTDMDLHNNEKGRDCWSVLTDGILWTSNEKLVDRVVAKIDAGEMVVLR